MLTVGLTGGIACGKSIVSKLLLQKGADIIDLDQVAREVVKPGKAAWSDIISVFGNNIVGKEGNIDRKKLGQVVFSDAGLREKLNKITHERIINYVKKEKERFYANPNNQGRVLVIDAPLLIEAGMDKMVDKIIVIICREEIQKERLIKRDRISDKEAEQRIKSQMPLSEKKCFADFIIDNSYLPENTRKQVDEIWNRLIKEMRNT
ncbi:MAG: dephospho-CoA kinase [Firmicutes bacterium HGW-Firmicutes-13]|nr:MAG: dephospho-CoA kinase [Firmicutes bacterium HGW-Firmicutes-13]